MPIYDTELEFSPPITYRELLDMLTSIANRTHSKFEFLHKRKVAKPVNKKAYTLPSNLEGRISRGNTELYFSAKGSGENFPEKDPLEDYFESMKFEKPPDYKQPIKVLEKIEHYSREIKAALTRIGFIAV